MESSEKDALDTGNSALANLQPVAPLWSVGSITEKCGCWGKKWFTIIVFASWVLLLGLIVGTIYYGTQWNTSDNDYNVAKQESDRVEGQWKVVNATVEKLIQEIKTRTTELDTEKATLQQLKDQLGNMSDTYHNLEVQYGEINANLKTVTTERDKYKEENDKLKDHNSKTQAAITALKAEAETLQHDIIVSEEEIKVFRLSTIVVGGVFVIGATDAVIAHIKLSSLKAELQKLHQYTVGFEGLASGYENYELLRWSKTKSVQRQTCFQCTPGNCRKEDLNKCRDLNTPTITSIKTKDGYKFGAVLFEQWKTDGDSVTDARAFTFSDTLAASTTIADPTHAMLIKADKLLQFGEGDIEVDTTCTTGSAHGHTYTVPHPYNGNTFYYNGTTFNVDSVHIEGITVV